MTQIKSAVHFITFLTLLACRQDDNNPPVVPDGEPPNPANAPGPEAPAPGLPPEDPRVELDPGSGTGPIASLGAGGSGGVGGSGGAAGSAGMAGNAGGAWPVR